MLGEMKEVGESEHSGDVVETKSSSRCLITEKGAPCDVEGVIGFNDSSSRILVGLNKSKRRTRVVLSDSESSDENPASPFPRKVSKLSHASVSDESGLMENEDFQTEKSVSVNNGLGVPKLDGSDGLNNKRITKDVDDDMHMLMLSRQNGDQREFKSGGSTMFIYQKKDLHLEDKSIMEDGEFNLLATVSENNDKDDFDEFTRNGHAEAEERKQRMTGVLDEKKPRLSHNIHEQQRANKKKGVMHSSSYSGLTRPGKRDASMMGNKERKLKLRKPTMVASDKVADESDASLHFRASSGMQPNKTIEGVKGGGLINTQVENATSVNSKTEKQFLREKIKKMLLGAAWTIDYRPRRNRDYLDSVYISPGGTSYWSITKAYDALRKEENDSSKASGDFTPLPNDLLSKLTRKTRKKIERGIEEDRRHEGKNTKLKTERVKKSARHRANDQHKEKLEAYMKPSRKSSERISKEASEDSSDCLSDNSCKETRPKNGTAKRTVCTNQHVVQGRESRKFGRRTLLVRGSDELLNSENNGVVAYSGKRTMLSWLIDSGLVTVGDEVKYMNLRKSRVMEKGWITRDGIHCNCCSKIVTTLRFELHAGSKLGQPFQNTFIPSGQSLMQCQIDAWNNQEESERKGYHAVDIDGDDPNDDTCGLCGDGGDLICCDSCPSTFHLSCLDMQMLPQGDWHCPNCACKYCDKIGRYCTKASGRTECSLFICNLCEKKYHKYCSPEMDDKPINSIDLNMRFCGRKCQELYICLQKLLWTKHELDSGFSWSLIHRSDPLPDMSSIKYSQRAECNSKVAVALLLMDECFLPIVDRRSGINLIHNVVYNCGSNISRLNYSGFFTAILERGDEMICAASIRFHGTQLAEMPFIGTRHMYRRQGMCRRLLHGIEFALSCLQIEKLVIPAIEEHMHTWTNAFGFKPLEESHKQEMRSVNMLVFPGTDMLQKPIIHKGKKGVEELELNDASICSTGKKSYAKAEAMAHEPQLHVTAEDTFSVHLLDGAPRISDCCEPIDTAAVNTHADSSAPQNVNDVGRITDSCEPKMTDTASVSAHADSSAPQNVDDVGRVTDSCEPKMTDTASANAHADSSAPQNVNDIGRITDSCEPKMTDTASVNAHADSSVPQNVNDVGRITDSCEPKMTDTASVSAHADSSAPQNVNGIERITDSCEPWLHGTLRDAFSVDAPSVFIAPLNGNMHIPLEPDLQFPAKESASMEIDLQDRNG